MITSTTDRVDVKPDLSFPRRITVERAPRERADDPYWIGFIATWTVSSHRYEIEELTLKRNTAPVTGVGLRTIALQELFETSVERSVEVRPGPDVDAEQQRLLLAARTYAIARAYGAAPLKAVELRLQISHSTASRAIARARTLGMVD